MGQAKRRGTYEKRKQRAIAIRQAELAEQRRILPERQRIEDHEADMRDAAMTPQQKRQKMDSRLFLAQMMGFIMGMGR